MISSHQSLGDRLQVVLLFLAAFVLFLLQVVSMPPPVQQLGSYSSIVVASFLTFDFVGRRTLGRKLDESRIKAQRRSELNETTSRLNSFLELFSTATIDSSDVPDDLVSRAEKPYSVGPVRELLQRLQPSLSRNQLNALTVFWLCYRFKMSKAGGTTSPVRCFQELDGFFRASYPDLRFSQDTKELMIAFRNVAPALEGKPMTKRELREVFIGTIDFPEFRNLVMRFSSDYAQQVILALLRSQRGEELRATIVRLVDEGRLTLYGIDREVWRRYQEELLRYSSFAGLYLVFKNLYRDLDVHLGSLQQFQFPALIPLNLGYEKGAERPRIYARLVRPSNPYPSVTEFINAEIKPHMGSDGGFVAVLPVDIRNAVVLPSQEDFEASSSYVSENYALISRLMVGHDQPDLAIWAMLSGTLPIQELLAALPFTILAKELTPKERAELWENYAKIKEEFWIDRLTDWSTVDPDELAQFLQEKIPVFALGDGQRLKDICQGIVREAASLRAAMTPSQDILAAQD